MAWLAPTFTGGVIWEDFPNETTPLNASDLNTEENAEATYAAQVGQSVVTYFESGSSAIGDPAVLERTTHKDQANGYPSLDATTRIPIAKQAAAVVAVAAGSSNPGTAGQVLVVRSDGTVMWTQPPRANVRAWGAKADGSDDKTAFVNATNTGLDVDVPAGHYRISSWNMSGQSTHWYGAGRGVTQIEFDDTATSAAFSHAGTQSAGYAITSDVNLNATSIIVADADAGSLAFNPGDQLLLRDPGNASQPGGAWVTYVTSVQRGTPDAAHATINVRGECPIWALVASGALVYKQVPVTFSATDLTFQMTPLAVSQVTDYMFQVLYHEHCRFTRVDFKQLGSNPMLQGAYLVQFRAGWNPTLTDVRTWGQIGVNQNVAAASLNVDFTNTTAVRINGLTTQWCCHGASLTGCPNSTIAGYQAFGRSDGGGRGLKLLNQSNFCSVNGPVIRGFDATPSSNTGPAWTGIHLEDSCYCTITGPNISRIGGIGISISPTVFGANNRTHHNVVLGGSVRETGLVGYPAAAPTPYGALIGWVGQEGDNLYNSIVGTMFSSTGGVCIRSSRNTVKAQFEGTYALAGQPTQGDVHAAGAGCVGNVIEVHSRNLLVGNGISIDTSAAGGANTILPSETGSAQISPALTDNVSVRSKFLALTDGATVNTDATAATDFALAAGGSRTIAAPSHPSGGLRITYTILNNTAGAIVTTWNAIFHLAGAWVDPAAGKRRTITFYYNSSFNAWLELGRAQADI